MDLKMPGTDLHAELLKTKKRSKTNQYINIDLSLDYKLDKINSDRIFHISDIKKICIDYRLRFLDFELFKGKVPDEAYKNLKSFYSDHKEIKREIKMMAPSSLFQLENYDDPLMFASLGNDYFYLIHKWGNDLSFFRKIMMWPFKSLYNIIIFMCFISLFITLIIPKDLFQYENNPGAEFFITYLFVLKSVIAIFIYYGFALGKNFNEYIWNRKFYN